MLSLLLVSISVADEPPPPDDEPVLVQIELGKSVLMSLPRTPRSVSITDPAVATVQTLGAPTTLMLQGKKLGTTDLVVRFGGDDGIEIHDLEVVRDLGGLRRMIEHVTDRSYDAPDPADRPPTVE